MRLADPVDPALIAATQALSRRAARHASRFASIELRGSRASRAHLAPLGYAVSALLAIAVAVTAWLM